MKETGSLNAPNYLPKKMRYNLYYFTNSGSKYFQKVHLDLGLLIQNVLSKLMNNCNLFFKLTNNIMLLEGQI